MSGWKSRRYVSEGMERVVLLLSSRYMSLAGISLILEAWIALKNTTWKRIDGRYAG